jgi:uroporphyrinogen decarboxylase
MLKIPESITYQINNPRPDIKQFVDVITGKVKASKVHFAELFADQEVMQWITRDLFEKPWIPLPDDQNNIEQMKGHLLCEIEYWHRMGYDYIRVTGGVDFGALSLVSEDSAGDLSKASRRWADMSTGRVKTWQDFETINWPVVNDKDVWMYQFVAEHLPVGMGIMACPASGFLEIPMEHLIGYEAMALMVFDEPELLGAVFDKVRQAILDVYKKVAGIDKVAGFFQGDDMGYKTGLLMSPDFLRQYVFPGHKEASQLAHSANKIYMLHSCGQLEKIMDELIDDVKIDAKHSYEDVIIPVDEFYKKYGERVAVIGGMDIDLLGRGSVEEVFQRARKILETCNDGRYAFGSGNTITNYCRKENILAMFDAALTYSHES